MVRLFYATNLASELQFYFFWVAARALEGDYLDFFFFDTGWQIHKPFFYMVRLCYRNSAKGLNTGSTEVMDKINRVAMAHYRAWQISIVQP